MFQIIGFAYYFLKALRSDKSVGMAILYGLGGALGFIFVGLIIGLIVTSIWPDGPDVDDEFMRLFTGLIVVVNCIVSIYFIDRLYTDLSWSSAKLELIKDRQAQESLKVGEKRLIDGRIIRHTSVNRTLSALNIGDEVSMDDALLPNGFYRLENDTRWEIMDGKLVHEYYTEKYKQKDGSEIEIDGDRMSGIGKGSRVWIGDQPAPEGTYRIGLVGKVRVVNGRIA